MKTIKNIKTVIGDNIANINKILRLSWYELIAQNNDATLGFLWNFITPALQIFVYWFVFAVGLKTRKPIDGHPFIIWLMVGIYPWLFISSSILAGSKAIISYSTIIKRMQFPMSIVPTKAVTTCLINHLFSIAIMIAILLLGGYGLDFCAIGIIYYLLCSLVLILGIAFLFSAIAVVSKDFLNILPSIIRLFFYMTPILWPSTNLEGNLRLIVELNPFNYIIEGYRQSLLGKSFSVAVSLYDVYFWVVAVTIFVIGIDVHMKFKNKFADLI